MTTSPKPSLERVVVIPPLHFNNLERHATHKRTLVNHSQALLMAGRIVDSIDLRCGEARSPEVWRHWRSLRNLGLETLEKLKATQGSYYALIINKRGMGNPKAIPTLYLVPADELVPPKYAHTHWVMTKEEEAPAA